MARQRVSDQLKSQDRDVAMGLGMIVEALRLRYPQSLELKCAARDLDDFAKGLEPEPEVQPTAGERLIRDAMEVAGYPQPAEEPRS